MLYTQIYFFSRDVVVNFKNTHDLDTSDVIVSCLLEKKEKGCTFSELQV